MASFTFYARGDSSTANNASINTENLSKTPVTELTFEPSGTDGDVLLEYNGGNSDPDTIMFVDGVATTFTVEFIGNLPNSSRFANINGLDLRGSEIIVVTDDSTGERYWFVSDQQLDPATVADFPNGATSVDNVNETPPPVVICFATETPIDTPDGPRPVEDLRPGDLVDTDLGPRPLLWTGRRHVSVADMLLTPSLRPITIDAGALGAGYPAQPITVSANHRVVVRNWRLDLLFGRSEALVAAKFLAGGKGIAARMPASGITYHHLMFDSHRLVRTAGLVSESFDPGPVGLATLTDADRAAVKGLVGTAGQDLAPHGLHSVNRRESSVVLAG